MKLVTDFMGKFFEERKPTQENIASEFANWIGGVGQNMIEEDMRAALAKNQVQVREERPLKELLAELDEEMLKLDDRLPGLFNPGLSPEEIKGTLQMEPVNPDLITLYTWHNGFVDQPDADSALFGLYRFMPLSEGLGLKKALSDFIPSYFCRSWKTAAATTWKCA